MPKITDYSFLFQSMFGTKNTKGTSATGSFQLSQLNSGSVQAQLRVAGIDTNSRKRIISIPEGSKDEMFELTKKEFQRENGVLNGDTAKRSDVYTNMYRKVQKNDRLAAGYTMEQYERAYRQAFLDAARKAGPRWEIGRPVPSGALDGSGRQRTNGI